METLLTWLISGAVLSFFVLRYWRLQKRQEARAREAVSAGPLFTDGPRAQHPHIHIDSCIGCGACVSVCPEGDVLGLVDGKATILHAHKCIGHGLCAEECPVGAIEMMLAKPSASSDMPRLTPEYETSVPNLFIVGELGGLALIKNAVNQGRDCVDTIAGRLPDLRTQIVGSDLLDIVIIGAGPAGISASLRANEHGFKTVTLERESVGGTVSKYPRQKLVMTSPVEFPQYGRFKKTQLSKEELLSFWQKIIERTELNIHTGIQVNAVRKADDGSLHVTTSSAEYRARAVVLAMGRAGVPRKLGVPGEELPHVLYRLIEADHYTNHKILVVGGGDSAIEAALGLASQAGNRVTISYRGSEFNRLKDRNHKKIQEQIHSGSIEVLYNSTPAEFRPGSVLLQCGDQSRELVNDYVWIFAGGTSPSDFLKASAIALGN